MDLVLNVYKIITAGPLEDLGNEIGNSMASSTSTGSITDVVNMVVKYSVPVATVALIVLFASAAYKMMMSQGNPEKLMEAKEVVTNAVSGFALIALCVIILLLINNFLQLGLPT